MTQMGKELDFTPKFVAFLGEADSNKDQGEPLLPRIGKKRRCDSFRIDELWKGENNNHVKCRVLQQSGVR